MVLYSCNGEVKVLEDQLIIKLFYERSERAIDELAKKYGKLCKAVALRITGNEQDAQECINDAYLAVWNTIPPQYPDHLSAYSVAITRNQSLKRYRSNTSQKRNNYYDALLDEMSEYLASDISVEDEILLKEMVEYINIFIGKCKQIDRVIFIKRYWFCMEIEEISKELKVSDNYVKVHLHRTRERCKDYLRKKGFMS